jgi:uncharacterized membrane protein
MSLFALGAVSHSGYHDSLVRGIVICYTKTFHLFNLLVYLLLLFTIATRIHLSEVLQYSAQSLSGPHMGGGWYAPL